jgi:hypothetical protein
VASNCNKKLLTESVGRISWHQHCSPRRSDHAWLRA